MRNKPKFMASIYLSKKFFLSQYEYKMYNLLENLFYDYRDEFGDLVVFSQVRLADIVKLFEENYNTGEYSFCDSLGKNPNKKSVYELINKFMPNFNNNDYKRAFLFPLLRSHIDFLICDHNEGTSNPILAIEVHGTEHDEQSANPDWKRIYNDRFKKSLFNPQNKAMNIRLLIVKNQELDDEKKLRDKIYTAINWCLDGENIVELVKKKDLLTDIQADVLESMCALNNYKYKGVRYAELGEKPASSSPLTNKYADKLMAELDKAGIKYWAKCAEKTVISVAASDKQVFDQIREALTNRLKNDKDKQTQT